MRLGRVLLKLSGESLGGPSGQGIAPAVGQAYAAEISRALACGLELAIVIGGGNIFRGLQGAGEGFSRVKGDQMGMLATVINSLALSQFLTQREVGCRVFTATPMLPVAEYYSVEEVRATMSSGRVAILAGGTGNPFFTTDSAAALRAAELECDALLKGTRVDGVYSEDPEQNPQATRYERLTFTQAYQQELRIMDLTAFTLCRQNAIPIIIFDMNAPGNLERLVRGENPGTLIEGE